MSRPRHPNKAIESAVQYAESLGWVAEISNGHAWLKPGGRLAIQTITYENFDQATASAFVSEIFPESDLPRLTEIFKATEHLFEPLVVRNDREHYIRTLQTWLSALKANRQQAVELVGEEVVARYEKYLSFFIIGFHRGTINLARLTLRRIDAPRPVRTL